MPLDEVFLQTLGGGMLQFAKHEVGLGLEDADARYLAQVGAQPFGLFQIGRQVGDGRLPLLQEEAAGLHGQHRHRPRAGQCAQQLYGVGVCGDVSQAQSGYGVCLAHRVEHQQVGQCLCLAGHEQRLLGVCLVRLVHDKRVARRPPYHIVDEALHEHVARRVVGVAYPIDAVLGQLRQVVGVLIRDDVVVNAAGIGILRVGGLRDDGRALAEHLCNEIDGRRGAVGHHDALGVDAQFLCDECFELSRIGFRIVSNEVYSVCDVRFQCRMVCMQIDIRAEVQPHPVFISVDVVAVSFHVPLFSNVYG